MATIQGFNESAASALFETQKGIMLGCQFASLVIDTFLATTLTDRGVLAMQMHKYFTLQADDKPWTKAIVIWTAIMNTVVTCYYWAYISYLFCTKYGQWLPWLEVRWLMLMPTFDVLCVAVVQGFFAYRAFLLMKRNWIVLGVIWALILAAVGGAIGVTIVFGGQESLLGADKSGPTLITWTSTTTAADVLIAGFILYGLLQSKSGWAHTDKLISRLVRLTFEAQLPPTFLSIAYLAEWCVQPSSLLGALFQAVQCKAYTVGLLFSLNSRIELVAKSKSGETIGNGAAPAQVYGMSTRGSRANQDTIQIQVEHETDTYVTGYDDEPKRGDTYHDVEEGQVKHEVPYGNDVSTTALTHPEQTLH